MDFLLDPLLAASLAGLTKQVLLTTLTVLNAVLAGLATLAIWRSYLLIGAKIALIVLVFVPVIGLLIYLFWGQRKVREAY